MVMYVCIILCIPYCVSVIGYSRSTSCNTTMPYSSCHPEHPELRQVLILLRLYTRWGNQGSESVLCLGLGHCATHYWLLQLLLTLLASLGTATLVQVIQDHAKDFLDKMNCEEIISELETLALIPESVGNRIHHSKTRTDANNCLFKYLKDNADEKTVSEVFRIASEKAGYRRMNDFAAFMLRKLQQGLY